MPSEETTIICGATVRTWTLYTGLALLWLMMAMIQYYTSICGDDGIVLGATLDEQFVRRMHTTIPLQWVAPMALCGLYTARSVLAPAYYEKIAHKKDCVGIPLKYVHAIMCVCMSCVIVSNCVSVFSDSLKAGVTVDDDMISNFHHQIGFGVGGKAFALGVFVIPMIWAFCSPKKEPHEPDPKTSVMV